MSEKEIVPAEKALPPRLPIIPLQGKPIFPGIFTPIMIMSKDDRKVVEEAIDTDKMIGLILLKDESSDKVSPDNLYEVGTAAKIVKKINLPDEGINIFISTLKRFRVKKYLTEEVPLVAAVEYLEDDELGDADEVKALTRSLLSEMKQISEDNPLFSEEMRLNMVNIDHPGKIADFISSILNIKRNQQQKILETLEIRDRMEQVLIFIKKEQELLTIQKRVQRQINDKIDSSRREYFLKEELKAIKQELGMDVDSKSSEYKKFKEALEELKLEGEAGEQVEKELEKFSLMEPSSSEYIVTRNYLDIVTNLPWKEPEPEDLNIDKGREILDHDHYGMEEVKDRIMEFLAVRKLKKDTKGSIVCLVGPPGVGKTSIGKSIAATLNKPFYRFSVGGMRDEAEIKGHRRTYVGALPGKIIQGLKVVKHKAPVFMIDEIDKLGSSYQGDPSSALLEVLDPEQNDTFRDHYLDLPFDVSHILFIVTANTLDSIPRPLLDRMEVIRLSGYIDDEKMEIAKRYIIPKSLKKHGLTNQDIRYYKTALKGIAEEYARDSGMRTFEKMLDKIHRKVTLKVVKAEGDYVTDDEFEKPVIVTRKDLEEYLGKPFFREDQIKKASNPGMALGLAWTSYGGDVLIIESLALKGKQGLKLTGQMGDVMKESASIAYTFVQSVAEKFGAKPDFFDKNTIHMHIPEGATPKDGPSAGITMATTLLSLASGRKIKQKLAMTGELSLAGQVLPIGGLREKTVAAKRNGVREIIIPSQNERDLPEIPDNVKNGITFHPVDHVNDVFKIVFPEK